MNLHYCVNKEAPLKGWQTSWKHLTPSQLYSSSQNNFSAGEILKLLKFSNLLFVSPIDY